MSTWSPGSGVERAYDGIRLALELIAVGLIDAPAGPERDLLVRSKAMLEAELNRPR